MRMWNRAFLLQMTEVRDTSTFQLKSFPRQHYKDDLGEEALRIQAGEDCEIKRKRHTGDLHKLRHTFSRIMPCPLVLIPLFMFCVNFTRHVEVKM